MVLLDERTGHYWQLNSTGASVLTRLLDGQQPEQIAVQLAERYELSVDVIQSDVIAVVDQLRDARLVETR